MIVTLEYNPIAYTIESIKNEEVIESFIYTVLNKDFDIPSLDEKDGYKYYWIYNDNLFTKELLTTGNVEVVQKEEVIVYEIEFVTEENELVGTRTYTVLDKDLGLLPTIPSKNGYSGAWYIDELEFASYELTLGDLEVVCKYMPNTYNLTFKDSNGNVLKDEFDNVIALLKSNLSSLLEFQLFK